MTATVTIRDIARHTGVSAASVSRALKQRKGLSEATRQSVIDGARQLGYDFTRLRKCRVHRIAFLLHRQHDAASSNSFYSLVLRGAEEACRSLGIALSFMAIGPADNVTERLRAQACDALLCAGFFEPDFLAALQRIGKPVALVDMKMRGFSSTNADNQMGGYLATQHLIALGHCNIGIIAGPLSHYSIRERLRGYRLALYESGILADPGLESFVPDGVDHESGARIAMEALLALRTPPRAVVCYNDVAALAAMRTCLSAGLRVPEDMSIVGFDDVPEAMMGHRHLTTSRVDKQLLGARGVALLLRKDQDALVDEILPVSLVVRASTRPRLRAVPRPAV